MSVAGAQASGHAAGRDETIRDLQDVPSFPAVYAATLARPAGLRRSTVLPNVAYRVRKVRIDPERAAAFDHLMGGPATELVHPGVLHVLAFPVSLSLMARGDFPVSLLGLVHVRNRVLQHRPVRVGEKIDVECRTRNLRPHRRGRTFEAVTTFHAADGTIVATDVSTYLAKDKKVSKVIAGGGSGTEGADASSAKRPSFVPQMPTARWSLGADAGRRYAEVSGDANPIHMSALTAKAFGFPRAVAHGMYTASRAFTESRVDRSRPLQWDVEFKTPVILPATVLVRFEDQPDSGGVTCEGWRAGRRDKPARLHFRVDVRTLD